MDRSTTIRPTGTISAPPTPWTMRSAVSSENDWLVAQSPEARVNRAIPDTKTVRAPKRSASHPLSGIRTATVTR